MYKYDELREDYSALVFPDGDKYVSRIPEKRLEYENPDASTVIQAALNSLSTGGRKQKLCLKGDFNILTPITLVNNVAFDLTEATLLLGNNVNDSIIKVMGKQNIEVIGGILDGNRTQQTAGRGILIDSCSDVKIKGTTIKNTKEEGVKTINLVRGSCESLILKDITGHGILFDDGTIKSNMIDCKSDITGGAGFRVANAAREISLLGCHSKAGGYCGIHIYFNPILVNVIGCSVEGVTFGWGIEIENAYHCSVIGCTVRDSAPSIGIKVMGISGFSNSIIGNKIYNVGRHGIAINSDRNTVIGNTIYAAGQAQNGQYDGIAVGAHDDGGGLGDGNNWFYNVIKGNCIMASGTYYYPNYLRHAFREYNSSDYNTFKDNSIEGTPTQVKVVWVGSHSKMKPNVGFVTENNLLNVSLGTSSTTIAHGLDVTPNNIKVLPRADARVWRSADPDATNIYLQASAAVNCDIYVSLE